MENISRRDAIKTLGGLGTLLVTGACAASGFRDSLPTNVSQKFEEGIVCVNEDIIRMQRTGLLGDWYFAIPMNNETRILNGGEPSFALIPESKSRTSIKQVGKEGGEVIVDAPEGDLYLPYVYETNGIDRELTTNFLFPDYVRLITNFKIGELKKPESKEGKISLDKITEKDFPFLDETLKTINEQQYIVNRIKDHYKFPNHENILPIYFTKLPISVEYNRAEKDGKIRIIGETYLFKKGQEMSNYMVQRGFIDPLREKQEIIKKEQSADTDEKQE